MYVIDLQLHCWETSIYSEGHDQDCTSRTVDVGICTRVNQVCLNVTDQCGNRTEDNCHDDSHPNILCSVVALYSCLSSNDNDMVASEEWLTDLCEDQTNCCHTEDKYVVRTSKCLNRNYFKTCEVNTSYY